MFHDFVPGVHRETQEKKKQKNNRNSMFLGKNHGWCFVLGGFPFALLLFVLFVLPDFWSMILPFACQRVPLPFP